jgi:phosphopantetheinyl transferase
MSSHRTILYYSAVPGELQASGASRAGRVLARRALGALLGRKVAEAELGALPGGKPYLPGGPDFSVSHAGPWVAAAATTHGRIGLDIETDSADGLSLRLVCDAAELALVAEQGATSMWVSKEAALKAWGLGVREVVRVRVRGTAAHLEPAEGEAATRYPPLHLAALTRFLGAHACIATSAPPAAIEFCEIPCALEDDP